MYELRKVNEQIFFPGDKEYTMHEAKLKQQIGTSGELTFTVPRTNPNIDNISERNIITLYKKGSEYWRGDVRETSTNFLGSRTFYCIEDLAFLGEVIKYAHSVTATYSQYFINLLNEYNSKVNDDRKFSIGYIQRTPSASRKFEFETMSILELLRNIAGDDYYVRVRRENGQRYIDIVSLSNFGKSNNQPIEFGENLMDFVKESNTSWLLTAIMPLGEELESETIPGIVDRVTIETVNAGSKVIINNDAKNRYGYIEKIINFSSTKDPVTLKKQAEDYLARNSQPRLTMEIKAIDLSWVENVDSFSLGDTINTICEPFGINQNVNLCEIEENLLDPSQNIFTLSSTVERRTLTDIQNEFMSELEDIPSKSEVLIAAKNNALKLLDGNQGGYVTFKFNTNNTAIESILITDQPKEENSYKKWVWNLSGLGYMSRKNITDAWTDLGLALTMNGEIVADFVTTGQMLADRVQGGEFEVGGKGFAKDGSIGIYNANGVEIGRWNKNGITINEGVISLGKYDTGQKDAQGKPIYAYRFTVNNNGSMSATSGYIAGWKIESNRLSYEKKDGSGKVIAYTYLNSDGTIETWRQGQGKTQFDANARIDCYQLDMHNTAEQPIAVYKHNCVNWADHPGTPAGAYEHTLNWGDVATQNDVAAVQRSIPDVSGFIKGSGFSDTISITRGNGQYGVLYVNNGLITGKSWD